MKLGLLLYAIVFFLGSTTLYSQTKIAIYDRTMVTQSTAYYSIHLLDTAPKTLKALKNLNDKIEQTMQKFLVEEESIVLQELQTQLRAYESKRATIKKVMRGYRYKNNKKGLLSQFIQEQYKEQYDVIIPRKFIYDNYGKVIINGEKTDITEQIIQDLKTKMELIH